jgi:hypothetical protein
MTMKNRPTDEPTRQPDTKGGPPDECERTRIGSWALPSGNSVDVSHSVDERGIGHLWFGWDRTPITLEEADYYRAVIFPAVAAKLGFRRWAVVEL